MNSPVNAILACIVVAGGLLSGCDDGTYASEVSSHELSTRAFSWDDEVQLGVFRPNGVKHLVTSRGEIPANAYHAVRINLPNATERTPPPPPGLTWRVVDVLASDPSADLSTELDLRHDAYVGHAGRWGADVVAMRARLLAESAGESEVSEGVEARAESLKAVLGQPSPRTGEPFELPDLEQDRRLRFVWAQRPLLADFALDDERRLERGVVVTGDCDACEDARNWAAGKGVRVVSLEEPEAERYRSFFRELVGEKVPLPFVWADGRVVSGFDRTEWDELFHVKQ